MIKFLLKGILRDRQRSLFPIIIVTCGVMLTVVLHCWLTGVLGDMFDLNARFSTGHVKVMTRAYAENADQMPNDLALLGANEVLENLKQQFPNMTWVKRIRFGGLLDVPDDQGETRAQGPAFGLAVDLFSETTTEIRRLNVNEALTQGRMPQQSGEMLISDDFASKLGVMPGAIVTLLSSTMYGSMALQNFTIAGTIRFGVEAMDRGAMIMDISDAQSVLDMNDAASEILGYFPDAAYDDLKAAAVENAFNAKYVEAEDEFTPKMLRLKAQSDLASYLDYVGSFKALAISIFVFAMSLVLWNAGLLGGLRRYGEVGLRLAIGEPKGHVYRSMIYESILIGIIGSFLGTLVGLGFAYYLQTKGFNISGMMQGATMMMPSVIRANITPPAYVIGFLPGLISTVLGTMLSGIGIYKRKTAQLFKELEV
ncbi:MAG TPA: FtsX-like permease family protein [bacterium]